jgi:hypothetical protein
LRSIFACTLARSSAKIRCANATHHPQHVTRNIAPESYTRHAIDDTGNTADFHASIGKTLPHQDRIAGDEDAAVG